MNRPPIVVLKCRICLGENEENGMLALFEENEASDEAEDDAPSNGRHLSQQIEFCCGIKVRPSPHLPGKICERCHEFVRMWYSFRQMCLNSQVYLESSCLDEAKPDEVIDASDSEYIEYLYETLQTNPAGHTNALDAETAEQTAPQSEAEFLDGHDYAELDVEAEEQPAKAKSPEMSIAMLYGDEGDEAAVSGPADSFEEDILSATPSPEPSPSAAGKRRPGRPRKPDHELKAKRKPQTDEAQPESKSIKYMCNLCGNVYQKKSAFTAHMTAHSDYKPHQCEICFKSFRQVGELRAHIRRHTGERPYKCLYCERHFYDRSEKVRHERVHTNTRPYACSVCGKTFTHTAILKNHSLVHSGQKNYSCDICNKSFTLLHQLKAHLQTLVHRNKAAQSQAHFIYTDNAQ